MIRTHNNLIPYERFFCAILCVARTMPSQDVCPSVCPSHAGIVSQRLNVSSNFSPSGSHRIQVFPHQTVWRFSTAIFITGASNAECMINRDFRPISCFISEMIQNRTTVTMECEKETVPKILNGTISNDLEWHLTEISRSRYSSMSSNSKTMQDRAIVTVAEY